MELNNRRLEEQITVIRKDAEALLTPIKGWECLRRFQKEKQLFWDDNGETKEAKMAELCLLTATASHGLNIKAEKPATLCANHIVH